MTPTNTALLAATGGAGYVGWVLISGTIAVVSVIRILRQPAERWKHPKWSKLAWILAALYLAPTFGGYPIPLGAIAAIYTTRRQTDPTVPGQIPQATGSSDWPRP